MTTYRKFEEMPVWKDSRKFVNSIYAELTSNRKFAKDYALCDQLKRASYSVMLNIAEEFERGSNKDNSHFMDFAKGSAAEVRSILYIALDNGYMTKERFDALKEAIEGISRQLSRYKGFLTRTSYAKEF